MCGRYLLIDNDDVARWVKTSDIQLQFSTNEVFPSQQALVLVQNKHEPQGVKAAAMRWGIEKWDQSGRIINARQETVATSRFFKDAFASKRAVVVAHGFYEWDNEKRKWLIKNQKHTLQYMAAVIKGEDVEEFAILTQAAQTDFERIHDRQPVFLMEDQISDYLHFSLQDQWVLKPRQIPFLLEDVSILQQLF